MNARLTGRRATYAVAAVASALLTLPASALASSGGGGTGAGGLGSGGTSGTGTGTGTSGGAPIIATPTAPETASGGGLTLDTTSTTMVHGRLVFSGTAPGAAGQTLEIERRSTTAAASTWQPALQTTVSSNGSFRAVWRARHPGRFSMRALVASGTVAAASADPTLTVTVYPTSKATIYGPGFFGRRTACGGRLRRTTIGVANRTLPCGTKVSILYDGRTLTVPVIDRGPYANGADWDLTTATAQALGIEGTSWIGTVALQPTTASDLRRGRPRRR